MTPARFTETARRNPSVAALLDRLPDLGLPQCCLTAGCLFQTVWNLRDGREPGWGIRDHDVFYWDEDTSWVAEDDVIRRAASLTAELGLVLEIRNQARVHLWYEERFGVRYAALSTARAGIDRFLVAGTAVGIDAATGEVYAPYGLDDLAEGLLRVNPLYPQPAQFLAKASNYRARWPWLRIVPPPSRDGDIA